MKKLIGTIFLTISLTILISILFLSFAVKKVVEDTFIEKWNNIIELNPFQTGNKEENITIDEENESDIDRFFHDVFGDEWNGTKETINQFIGDHKSDLEEILGIDISDDMIYDISEAIKNKDFGILIDKYTDNQLFQLTSEQKMLLKIYRIIATSKFSGIIIFLIIINILLLALVQFSFYKWIKPFSWSCILSGVLLWGIRYFLGKFFSSIGFSGVSFDMLLRYSILLFVFGFAIRIGYLILSIIIDNMKKNHLKAKKMQNVQESTQDKEQETDSEE